VSKTARVLAVLAALFALVWMVIPAREGRRPGAESRPPVSRVELPRPSAAPEPAPRLDVRPGPERPDPERLRPWLETLGRARLLRDARTLERLAGEVPPIHEGDVAWIVEQLQADLFTAAGAAEMARWHGLRAALPGLSGILAHPGHRLLKDVAIQALAGLGGDAAAVALLGALRNDSDPGIRTRCASALGSFDGPEAYQGLVAALHDAAPQVRSAAAAALARLKAPQLVEVLLGALAAESDPEVQADLAVGAYAAGRTSAEAQVQEALARFPAAAALLGDEARARDASRYRRAYERSFFEPGQPSVPWDGRRARIGITVELGSGVGIEGVAASIFSAAPFDRYRNWFVLRRADEFPSARAYGSDGRPLGDVPFDSLDGTVYLRFRDASSFAPGILGYSEGREAYVTHVSFYHEIGHALARLADEYAGGSTREAPNLWRETAPPSWQPLVEADHLPAPARREPGVFVPSENCHMGNRGTDARFCPVCQLEIHARICDLTGLPLPW
jgi:hypothetical protein